MFQHFIKFITTPELGTIEISEPIGFDQSSYKVKQDDKRFGRDIIIANEDSELTFSRSFFEELGTMQTLPNGDVINHASLGFDYLIDIFETEGWEGKIEYLLLEDNILFSTGIFSYVTAVVEFDNIKVKIIQNTNREIIKRLEDTDIDAFNDTALDGRTITPCQTTDILLKAKPTVQESIYSKSYGSTNTMAIGRFYTISLNRQITQSDIRNTLTPISDVLFHPLDGVNREMTFAQHIAGGSIYFNAPEGASTKLIVSQTRTSQIKVNIKFKGRMRSRNGNATSFIYYIMKSTPNQFFNNYSARNYEKVLEVPLNSTTFVNVDLDISFNSSIVLQQGEILYGGYSANFETSFIDFTVDNSEINIIATATAPDSIGKGIRLIDLAKHNVQSLANVQLIAPDYDVNGEHYDNFAFNGLLLGQITNKPFPNKFGELMNFVEETCSDYQINPTTIEVLPYEGYYPDVEIAVFDNIPSLDASSTYNKRYSLKTANFKYKRSSDKRATNGQNSIDDVHTETQKFISENVDSNLPIEINAIRSAPLIEEARIRSFDNDQTKALEFDDNLFLLKCVPLAPNSQSTYVALLLMRVLANGNLEILNNNQNGDGLNFSWTQRGISVGGQFFIDAGQNIGTYTVVTITSSILTLQRVSGVTNFSGDALISMRWTLNNVLYTNQTDEGYTLIEGVANPTNYSNLDYHWARNIKRWYKYLATATKFKPNGVIKTASFKTNGLLKTQKIGESAPIEDSADIVNAIIATEKILTPMVHTVKVYSDFAKTTQLINDVQNIKGYVTVKLDNERTIKGYVKEMEYLWITEELDLVLEEKFEGDFMEITSTSITYPQYPNKNNLASFQVNNIFVLLFDSEDVQLYPPVRFTKIKINGVAYTDLTAFTDALTNLIN